MSRRFSLQIVIIALALVATPTVASGATGLTESGTLIAVGSKFRLSNVGSVATTARLFGMRCGTMSIPAKLSSNSLTTVAGFGEGTGTALNCVLPTVGESKATVTNLTLASLNTTGGGKGTITLSFEAHISSEFVCKYSGAAIAFTYNATETSEGGDLLTVSEAPLVVTPAGCNATTLDGKFTIETNVGSELKSPLHLM